jgi:hypothetical protein
MAEEKGFASGLWKNVQAIRLGKDGGIEAPVRADGRDGIVVGVNHVADAEADAERRTRTAAAEQEQQKRRGWWARLRRRP